MTTAVDSQYSTCKQQNETFCATLQELEEVKLERDKHQLMNIILEQEVESQIDR
jgi:hypothetical protein